MGQRSPIVHSNGFSTDYSINQCCQVCHLTIHIHFTVLRGRLHRCLHRPPCSVSQAPSDVWLVQLHLCLLQPLAGIDKEEDKMFDNDSSSMV